ncbi:SLBB domain-containing protein [candidate division KSB1 bacterium]|nr:SLBB domain-containing protein [candidate division KSB1 bacterium]
MVENRAQKNVRADLYQTLLQPQSNETPLLQAGDRIFVPPAQRWIAVAGEVHRPAIFELRDDDSESLSSALALAGGTTSLADTLRLEWSRLLPEGRRETQVVNLAETHANGSFAPLRHGDRITVYSKLTQAEVPQVAVYGEVIAPGIYAYEENLRVSDLILRAGGLSRAAYLLEAELARIDPGQPPYREKIALHKILLSQTSDNASGKSADDALLRPDDQLFIRRIPDWRVGPLVEIRGEVKFPGMYAIDWGKTRLSEICQLAGGPTPEASLHEARLYRRRLEHAPLQTEATLPAEILTRFDHEKIKFDRDRQEASLISVDFAKLLLAHEAQHDVVLAPGDLIEFPRQSRLVYVTGAVGLPGGIPFVPGEKVSGYIARAGGFGLHASRSRVKVVRATGEIVNDEDAGPLAAGDTIWVPTRSERSSWNTLRDFVTVAAQLATIYVVIDRATGN